MILPIHHLVRSHMAEAVGRLYVIPPEDAVIVDMALETPPRRALGDIAVPIAFALARRLRKAPRAIAQELAAALGRIDGIARIEAAPNGYINFFLDRAKWLREWASQEYRGFRLRAQGAARGQLGGAGVAIARPRARASLLPAADGRLGFPTNQARLRRGRAALPRGWTGRR